MIKPDNIVDITPQHSPVSLAKSMARDAPNAVAGIYVLVDENGDIDFNMCGHSRMAILWGLAKLQAQLMEGQKND